MILLTLEENNICENDQVIPDFSVFLKNLSPKTEIALIVKTHDALFHVCPVQKAVPYLKGGEFSSDYWVGEKAFPKGLTLIGGILPSLFMKEMVDLLAGHSFALKGVFLWADLVTEAYGPLPLGWSLVCHDHHLMICHDGVLRFSRPCHSSLAQEIPAILRYLKRFGYQENMPITLLKASFLTDTLPPFMHQETRAARLLSLKGFRLNIPQLRFLERLYDWPCKIRKTAYLLTFLNTLGMVYLSWQINTLVETKYILTQAVSKLPVPRPMDETKIQAFKAYCHLSKNKENPLPFLRALNPLIKEEAVTTHFYWIAAPLMFTLHLELKPSSDSDQLLFTLRSQFQEYALTWQVEENDPLKGTLTIKKKTFEKEES